MSKDAPGEDMQNSSPEQRSLNSDIGPQLSGTLESFKNDQVFQLQPWKHRADTSRRLAYGLIAFLALGFILHFAATFVFVFVGKLEATAFKDIFTMWLPVLSGLASAAVTYYFTKER